MDKTLQGISQAESHLPHSTLGRGMAWGLIGGLAGTMLMDILLMGVLSVARLPAFTCFSIVGETVARLFSILGLEVAGGILLGVATHYLIGPLVGVLFGAVVVKIKSLRGCTLQKGITLAVIYVEILSQPILATTPILLKMTPAQTLKWFGGSFVMHFIFGVVLGAVVYSKSRMPVINQKTFHE